MPETVETTRRLIAVIAAICACSLTAIAGEVTLRAKSGDFEIKGELTAYDSTKYTIQSTSLGAMSLDASRFDCVRGSCPTGEVAMRTEPGVPDPKEGPASE